MQFLLYLAFALDYCGTTSGTIASFSPPRLSSNTRPSFSTALDAESDTRKEKEKKKKSKVRYPFRSSVPIGTPLRLSIPPPSQPFPSSRIIDSTSKALTHIPLDLLIQISWSLATLRSKGSCESGRSCYVVTCGRNPSLPSLQPFIYNRKARQGWRTINRNAKIEFKHDR